MLGAFELFGGCGKHQTREHDKREPCQRFRQPLGKKTGFAIPLGAIAARKTVNKAHLERIVQDSLRWAYAHDAQAFTLCRAYSQDLNPDVVRAHIQLYVNAFSEHIGPEGRAAVDFFLQEQQEFRAQAVQ